MSRAALDIIEFVAFPRTINSTYFSWLSPKKSKERDGVVGYERSNLASKKKKTLNP